MEFDIYEIEKQKIKFDILFDIKKDLCHILFYKIRNNSKAYTELESLIEKLEKNKNDCQKYIKESLSCNANPISQLKIHTEILKDLFTLKKEFESDSISEVISLLIAFYKHDKLVYSLSKIDIWEMPKSLELNLLNSKFNICTSEDTKHKIVYTTDDLVIEDNIEYLDLEKFKLYNKSKSEYYLFSPNFTLADLDDFFHLLFK